MLPTGDHQLVGQGTGPRPVDESPIAFRISRACLFPFSTRFLNMSRVSAFLFGMGAGALILHAAMTYHVVRANDGIHVVPKNPPRMAEAFVDVRQFTMSDWAARPELASSLVQANKQHLMGQSAAAAVSASVEQLLPDWTKP